jgi:hypothetical protein
MFRDVGVKRQQLECELQLLDEKESESSLFDDDRRRREECKIELEEVAHMEEASWRQKS